ncbi:hypothetical protein [Opitutus terrae]|uniref:TonB family protein n=1 Tax=Opitutus terrae (strain DSM 11246 / JCM 15787 / PB90-1) TaxID=452637 RepID=B1ZYD1_OPITP|nr:hypothetical protein [Opitutus terrae]ACB77029.1 hypothetical protein Oter_3754 [Opitutus terrae PB90-1]
MSQTYVPPNPWDAVRRKWARWWDDPDARSVTIGLLGMLLVHLLLFLIGPHLLRHDPTGNSVLRPHSSAREFNIELAPDTFVQTPAEKPPPPMNFVEANPNAPDNVPDNTNNFAAQNQQVAQPTPTPDGKSDRPAIEGKADVQSTAIVSGQLTQPQEAMPAAAPVPEQPAATIEAPRRREVPLPGFEKTEGENESSYGSNIAKFAEGAKSVDQEVEGVEDAPLIQGATGAQPAIDPKRPRPRPQVVRQQQVRPAIFQENKFGTQNIGAIAYDAKWSNYGQYLQKMIETVQIQWERILIESRVYPVSGTHVRVVFVMNDQGAIARIANVEGTAGNQAEKACTSAITARAPYGEWTDDMKAVLGAEQELTFTFYYQ